MFYTCPKASTIFFLAAPLAGMIAANMDSNTRDTIKEINISGTMSTYKGTDMENPGGV